MCDGSWEEAGLVGWGRRGNTQPAPLRGGDPQGSSTLQLSGETSPCMRPGTDRTLESRPLRGWPGLSTGGCEGRMVSAAHTCLCPPPTPACVPGNQAWLHHQHRHCMQGPPASSLLHMKGRLPAPVMPMPSFSPAMRLVSSAAPRAMAPKAALGAKWPETRERTFA